ncbi:MAG: phosphate ABC transporter substrate-binding protein [Symploca sp. SIO2E6]|nr:phosphate ABC transporter substrate-binding protein [Symploca sp. SIO2E6]
MMKNKGKELLKEASRRQVSNLGGRLSSLRSRFTSGLTNLVPNQLRWMVPFLQENIEVSTPDLEQLKGKLPQRFRDQDLDDLDAVSEVEGEASRFVGKQVKSVYPKYDQCPNPLACQWSQQTIEEEPEAKYCLQCGFPAILAPEAKIQGNRARYQVESLLGQRGMGRLYNAIQLPEGQPVVLKEYLLPQRHFNYEETKQRKDEFTRLAKLDLADGRVQDFRLITPFDAIADSQKERCYLITPGNLGASVTLANYLAINGSLSSTEVRQVLKQVLQSLEFLHTQKFRLGSGQIHQGLTHGNLRLDSLLITVNFQGFFIYLCDLESWERQFRPPLVEPPALSRAKDLKDLGYIAFYLLAGGRVDPNTGKPLDPSIEEHWPAVEPVLKNFILNLIGINFPTAEIARQALLKLPVTREIQPSKPPLETTEEVKKTKGFLIPWFLLGTIGLLLLAALIWWLTARSRRQEAIAEATLTCCIEQVSGIPSGKFTYTASQNGPWSYVLTQPNLIAKEVTLEAELNKRQPQLQLTYQPEPSVAEAIANIQSKQAEFAIASFFNNLSPDLGSETFAYDGLVVFVPFSYIRRKNNLPQALKGKISLEQLRQLYTGKITNWRELGGPDLPVKLYIPDDDEARRIFQERVLVNQTALNSFNQLIRSGECKKEDESTIAYQPEIIPCPTFKTLRQVIRGFENEQFGGIAFGSLSKVLGQCSVYPLDLVTKNSAPIAPLIQDDGKPVTPNTDLCNDKGSYEPNQEQFLNKSYPLAYSLAVVYPRDNSREPIGQKFAEILKTVEAQRLLSKTGLVPLQKLGE